MYFKGVTLIELLVAMGIFGVLTMITLGIYNIPRLQANSRNAQRSRDVSQVYQALVSYVNSQNNKALPEKIKVCDQTKDIGTESSFVVAGVSKTMAELLVPTYLPAIPVDPSNGTAAVTGYVVCRDPGGRIKVIASGAELGKTISVGKTSNFSLAFNPFNPLSGLDAEVEIGHQPDLSTTSELTISLWMYSDTNFARGTLISKFYDKEYELQLNTDNRFWLYQGSCSQGSSFHLMVPLELEKWYHIALTRSNNGLSYSLYINGVFAQTVNMPCGPTAGNYPVTIGSRWSGIDNNHPYSGMIDDVRIYKKILTQPQIQEIMDYYSPIPEGVLATDLVAYWPFDEGGGLVAGDTSFSPLPHNGRLLFTGADCPVNYTCSVPTWTTR